jgi:CBS domain-containing protein
MSVGRICVRHIDVADPNESALIAARRMQNRHVGTLVVVDKERRPQGILTDRDLVVHILAQSRDADRTLIGDVMSKLPTLIHEETPIEEALAVMRSGPYRRLIVIDRPGHLVGILSLDDILALVADEFKEVSGLLSKESPQSLAAG